MKVHPLEMVGQKVLDMGGLAEDNLSQMIRDYYNSGSRPAISYSPSQDDHHEDDHFEPTFVSLQEILANVTDAEKELGGKILLYPTDMKAEELRKRIVKKLGSDYYEACLCKTSWITTSSTFPSAFQSKRGYEYIDVMMKHGDDGEPVRLIVDIEFRSQFELARPSPAYQKLSNSLPCVFVGTEEKLMKIISLVCPAAKQSFKESGLRVPPWRRATYMHSKWLSMDCKKIPSSELDVPPDGHQYEEDFWSVSVLHKPSYTDEPTSGKFSRCRPARVQYWF